MINDQKINPFELTKGSKSKIPKRLQLNKIWTDEEQKEKTDGFIEIPQEYWSHIRYGSYINYINSENEFKVGGFVLKSEFIYKNDTNLIYPKIGSIENNDKRKGFQFQSSPYRKNNSKYFVWVVPYEKIKIVFLKTDASIKAIIQSFEIMIENNEKNNNKIINYLKYLENKIKSFETILLKNNIS